MLKNQKKIYVYSWIYKNYYKMIHIPHVLNAEWWYIKYYVYTFNKTYSIATLLIKGSDTLSILNKLSVQCILDCGAIIRGSQSPFARPFPFLPGVGLRPTFSVRGGRGFIRLFWSRTMFSGGRFRKREDFEKNC